MKSIKMLKVSAVIVSVLISVIFLFVQVVLISTDVVILYNQYESLVKNEIERYASDEIKEYIYIPERLPEDDDIYEAYGIDMQVFNRFILTEEEAKTIEQLIENPVWNKMSDMKFSDESAEKYWSNIMSWDDFQVQYNTASACYLIYNYSDGFITSEDFVGGHHYEIVIYDQQDNSYYYINFSI